MRGSGPGGKGGLMSWCSSRCLFRLCVVLFVLAQVLFRLTNITFIVVVTLAIAALYRL